VAEEKLMSIIIHNTEPTLAPVKSFLAESNKSLLIGDYWVSASAGRIPTHDPATGALLAYIARGSTEDVDRAVIAARQAFAADQPLRHAPAHHRLEQLTQEIAVAEAAFFNKISQSPPLAQPSAAPRLRLFIVSPPGIRVSLTARLPAPSFLPNRQDSVTVDRNRRRFEGSVTAQ
jgi:hypothetical protein